MSRISGFITKHMAAIIALVALLCLFAPKCGLWIEAGWIKPLLMLIMFGMGMTLKPADFLPIAANPRDIFIGTCAQFLIMPTVAFLLAKAFGLNTAMTVGVVLVGACPGGTASNVITFLAGGDLALSVGMTVVNTLLAPVLTPAIVYLFLRAEVDVDFIKMALSILEVVIAPIAAGFIINKFFKAAAQRCSNFLPSIAILAIAAIVACVVSRNAGEILSGGAVIFIVVMLHNLFGFIGGFFVGRLFKMNPAKVRAMSIEIGMQNSGLAASLAQSAFSALSAAAVPAAIFSVWHNISGAIAAHILKTRARP